ncbi:MAG: hypothetical protein ABI778_05170 [Ignavibacteriota bacterium]
MKLRLLSFSASAMLLAAGAFFSGCTPTDSPSTGDGTTKVASASGTDTYLDITGLSANTQYEFKVVGSSSTTTITGFSSYTNNTIRVFWSRGAGDVTPDTVVYKAASTADAGFYLWATADMTVTPNPSGIFRIYETADLAAGHGSGLILGPTTKVVSISGADKPNVDLLLLTDNSVAAPFLTLISADASGLITPGHTTLLGDNPYNVAGGLAMQHSLTDISSKFLTSANYEVIRSNIFDNSSIVLYVKTSDNHYARLEIVPQTVKTTFNGNSGNFLWGDTGGTPSTRFIDVKVTYQPTTNWGYVGRPEAHRTGTNTPRVATGAPIAQ